MLPTSRRSLRAPAPTRLDQAALVLTRVVMVRGWCPEEAARQLRARLDDDRLLLHLLRARVASAMLHRPTGTDERAFATLECALDAQGQSAHTEGARLPRQRRAHD